MSSSVLSPILFSASVPAHHMALEPGDFEAGLYYGLLLERSLAFLDSSFFVIRGLQDHVNEARQRALGESWLEMGLRTGSITPLVREEVTNFNEILDVLLRDKYIGASESQRGFADLLDRKVSRMPRLVWPSRDEYGFSDKLAKRINGLYVSPNVAPFANGLCDLAYEDATRFWTESREWRETWVPKAMKMRHDISGPDHGLRLLDVIQVAGRDLLGDRDARIESASDLLRATERVLDPRKQRVLRDLLILLDREWLKNFCEGMNMCGVPIGLMDHRWHPIVSELNPEADYTEMRDDDLVNTDAGVVGIPMELPSLNALKATPARVLEEIWSNGGAYFQALEEWRSDPSDVHAQYLGEQLASYSQMAMRKIGAEAASQPYDVKVVTMGDLLETMCRIASGLIAYSTVGSGPAGIVMGVGGAFLAGVVLSPIRGHFVRERRRVRTTVRLGKLLPPNGAAIQFSQSEGIFGRRVDMRLSPFKDHDDCREDRGREDRGQPLK